MIEAHHKTTMNLRIAGIVIFALSLCVRADSIKLKDGTTLNGSLIQTNGAVVLIASDTGTFTVQVTQIDSIQGSKPTGKPTGRTASFREVLAALSRQKWATGIYQVPATVIDRGVFRNVPYLSFRCGGDYEINVYGDLESPAGIEAGVYNDLLQSESAKRNCLDFIASVLSNKTDTSIVRSLGTEGDSVQRNGLTMEVTPPTADDSYGGWWISAYSESELNSARASDVEIASISIPAAPTNSTGDWTAGEMKMARSLPEVVTVTDSLGNEIVDAVVVRSDGAYLIWRKGASGGRVKLADLPQASQRKFGFEASKAQQAYDSEARRQAALTAASDSQRRAAEAWIADAPQRAMAERAANGTSTLGLGYVPSSGGRVFVRGYTRKDGTYVRPHSRRR